MTEKTLERKIKKNLYGRSQNALAIFPPGFAATSLAECQAILADPWLPTQFSTELRLLKNEIRLDGIHLFQLMELLLRAQSLADVRLIIGEGKVSGKKSFEKKCRDIPWELYLHPNLSIKVKVDSVASRAFHEIGLKMILSEILAEHGINIVHGENAHEDTTIYAQLYHNKLTLGFSLAGESLYKRGYRGVLSASAPLREDAAACCMQKCLQFARQYHPHYFPTQLLIPFSGTGTFAFEYLQMQYHFVPGLFGRDYAMQKMPFFRQTSFDFLLKKARERCELNKVEFSLRLLCIDHSQVANAAFKKNQQLFAEAVKKNDIIFPQEIFLADHQEDDFFAENFFDSLQGGDIFLPLNPPYGIRLGKQTDAVALYKKIATKIRQISKFSQKKNARLAGFILCPSQETWSAFWQALICEHEETYHFTQGGMDIRVCQFVV